MILVLFAERRTHDVVQLTAELAGAVARASGHRVTRFCTAAEKPNSIDGVVTQDLLSLTAEGLTERLRASGRGKGSAIALVSGRTEQALASIDAADMVLLSSDLTVASLRRLQRTARFCESLGIGRRRTGVVLLTTGDEPVSPGEARTVLKREAFAIVPTHEGRAAAIRGLVARLLAR